MKKCLLFVLVAMMSLVANAQQFQLNKEKGPRTPMHNAPAKASGIDGTEVWGYYLGNDISDFTGLGANSSSYRVGIKVPGDGVLKGTKIRGVNVPALSKMTNVSGWVATGTKNSTVIASKTVGTIQAGFSTIEFDEAIDLPESGLYVGYTFTSTDTYPIPVTGESVAGGLFLATSATGTLTNYSTSGYGVSGVQVYVEGLVLPENGVSITGVECNAAAKGGNGTVTVSIMSNGSNGVSSLGYTLTVNGVETTGTVDVTVPGGLNKKGQVDVNFTAPEEIGAFPASIAITSVNGKENELGSDPTAFTVNTLTRIVPRMTVIEEYTGTGCGWCPRGWVGMEAVKNLQSDKALVVAWHNYNSSDAMYQATYAKLSFDGAPQCTVDRKIFPDPYYGESEEGILSCVDKFNKVSSTVDVKVKANFVDETNSKVQVSANTEFLTNTNGYTIAFVLTADDLTGTTSAWKQQNYYYSNYNKATFTGALPEMPELAEFCKGGSYGKSSVQLTFNDVLIGSTYNSQGKSQVAAFTNTQAGDVETSEYTLTMPTKAALVSALNYQKIYVTAIVVDKNGQIANAARIRVLGAGEEDEEPTVPAEPIEIDGIKVSEMSDNVQLMGEAMSPNAKYVVGMNFSTFAPSVWNVETGDVTDFADFEEGAFHAANSNGVLVGDDGNYAIKVDAEGNVTKLFYNEGEEVYNEEWDFYYSTGDAGSSAYAVSENGKVVAGFYYDQTYFTTPCIWNEKNERIDLPLPTSEEAGFEVNGGEVRYMTPDGKVLAGFLMDNYSTWPACIWRQNANGGYDCDIISKDYWEEGYQLGKPYMVFNPSAISENGEWLALLIQKEYDDWDFSVPAPTMQIARLNLTTGTLEVLPEEEVEYAPTGIANDGTMLAYTGGNDMMGRAGYMWEAGKTTVKSVDDILSLVPELDELASNTPCSISADGNYIQGFGVNGENIFSYVVDYKEVIATGINGVKTENTVANDAIYNIAGQRIAKMQKGLNIVNGKKIMVK